MCFSIRPELRHGQNKFNKVTIIGENGADRALGEKLSILAGLAHDLERRRLGRLPSVTIAFGVCPLFLPLAIAPFGAPEGWFILAIIAFGACQFIVLKYYCRLGKLDMRSLDSLI